MKSAITGEEKKNVSFLSVQSQDSKPIFNGFFFFPLIGFSPGLIIFSGSVESSIVPDIRGNKLETERIISLFV